jgi:hypothetical protein
MALSLDDSKTLQLPSISVFANHKRFFFKQKDKKILLSYKLIPGNERYAQLAKRQKLLDYSIAPLKG